MFLHAPGGKKDGVRLISTSEVTTKDEFFNIKNATRADVLAAHRTPPLMGIVPNNTGGFEFHLTDAVQSMNGGS